MNSKSIKTCAFLLLAILIITVIFCVCAIARNVLIGKTKAYEQYTELLSKTYELSTKININSSEFTNQYTKTINTNSYIASVVIQDNKSALFAYPLSSSYISFDENNEPYIKSNSAFIKVYSSSLPIQSKTIQVVCAIYTVLPDTIFGYIKIALLVIVISTLLTFLIMLLSSGSSNKASSVKTDDVIKDDDVFDWDKDEFEELSINDEINAEEDDIPYPNSSKPIEKNDFHNENEPIEEIEPIDDDFIQEEPVNSIDPDTNTDNFVHEKSSPLGDNVSDPLGLFSDVTGFGWESYLETRLDAELVRAASSEQDLSLVIVKFPKIQRYDSIVIEIAKQLLISFSYRDLIFEYNSDGFAGILPSTNLENTMILCEKLYKELVEIFATKNRNLEVGFGISTRTYRLIPGQRLIQEANQAADKALQEEDVPVVAFRPNAEKYKQYLKEEE